MVDRGKKEDTIYNKAHAADQSARACVASQQSRTLNPIINITQSTVSLPPVGKRGAHKLVHGDLLGWGSTRYWNYLEDYLVLLCAGGLSVVNAIGTQLRGPLNSGLTRWRSMAVEINGRRRENREESRG